MRGRQHHHTGPLEAAPAGGGTSVCLSLVTVPRVATVERAGLAGAVVTARDSTGEAARVAGVGPESSSTVVAATAALGRTATPEGEVTSAGAGGAGSGGVLVAHPALCGRWAPVTWATPSVAPPYKVAQRLHCHPEVQTRQSHRPVQGLEPPSQPHPSWAAPTNLVSCSFPTSTPFWNMPPQGS